MTEYEKDGMLDEEFCLLEELLLIGAESIARRFLILGIIAVFIGFFV